MHTLTGVLLGASTLLIAACASAPLPAPETGFADPDTLGALWGDEYEGAPVEIDEPVRVVRGINAEWVEGDTRSTRVDAFSNGARVRLRSTASRASGAFVWQGTGVVRDVTLGHVAPVIAEGALVGDPRTSADLRAPAAVGGEGLRLRAMSTRAPDTGAGLVLAGDRIRVALAGFMAAENRDSRAGFASIEHRLRGTRLGVAGGVASADSSLRAGGSFYASRVHESVFLSGEVAVADGRVRSVARVVAGERREWSALAIAGAGPAGEAPLVFASRERWGAALERRDGWSWGSSRAGISSLTRRDAETDVQRRRAFWDGEWRIRDDARVELGARVTREKSERAADGTLAALPRYGMHDDWRARATLRARRSSDSGWIVENAYRVEWVQNRSGRPGTIATWTTRLRAGALDARFSASAHALHRGQVAYSPEPTPLASGEFASVTGKGAAMSGSFRVWLRGHAWLGAAWSQRPPAASRLWITLGLHT